MKIIFTKDVPRTGRKYEIKDVAPGFGRHLVTSGVAEIATPEAIARIERKRATDLTQKQVHADLLKKNIADMEGVVVALKGKANDQGHLFASIHKEEILRALKEATRLEIHPDFLVLEKPIKELGDHSIPVRGEGMEATLLVRVEKR